MIMVANMERKGVGEMHLKGNYYVRYQGVMMACHKFEVVKKPQFTVVFVVEYIAGLWVLSDAAGKSLMNNFNVEKLMVYVVKMLK